MKSSSPPPVVLKTAKGEDPVPFEVMEQAIIKVSEMGKAIIRGRLGRRAICLLICDMTNLGIGDIDAVLTALPELEKKFLRDK